MDFQEQQQQQKKNFHKKIDWKPLSRDLPAFTDSRRDVDVLYNQKKKPKIFITSSSLRTF